MGLLTMGLLRTALLRTGLLRMVRGLRLLERAVLDLPPGHAGVLPNQYLAKAVDAGVVRSAGSEIPVDNIQPASLDLRLGPVGYRIRCSFLPTSQTVRQRMADLVLDEFSLAGAGAVLTPGFPCLIPLKEELQLPPEIRARANPKSSTGRADVFTRVITDRSYRFDEIAAGYEGRLYLEVVPLSFPILLREDLSLNQLRLSVGHAELDDDEIRRFHAKQPLIFERGVEVAAEKLELSGGLFLGLDLRGGTTRSIGYRARNNPPLLDMTRVGATDPREYWERVELEGTGRIILTPKVFYLLMSYEAVTIPPTLAAEMTAYDPTSGELRTHYAGFFDPGFGYDDGEGGGESDGGAGDGAGDGDDGDGAGDGAGGRFKGSTAALEVRAHDVAFMVEHRQPVCKLTFERMVEAPTQLYGKGIGSNYQQQTETLGKHFRLPSHAGGISRPATGATPPPVG
jgi:dCTP deaminase